ncbi:uncharacterized protein [Lepeophtheirus salmonis]|uniref:uncharacterized protein isoform X1 n=1 Tax=Lepeophtheirus salmonis TaxID=72036 RepID=UPI001AE39FFD|nr:putative uncharacterized protein DDB_G0282133 isoform X1 [Lepeophtheirus salmonis]XP_040579947.1 putative uncharacterized protein DDB_G0282133 isoform X1 [Lepeophtheirus salmonis]XP_040579948.1 putative uncharacterized protein DDB_G0282133 isoform X1 [Lepeophtheirus salmonis]XP_040579949.1 putative uncharacterized protein DDB_G0282133 isoform X1 [Lepeophtheirus salmonis]XP_040579950.1 putative uncharacterized protein DDB_G0282133 isoform X1 [Lepeophtheirus salmonis]XP_040579951.1 putative u
MPPPPGLDEDDETLSLLANQDSPGLSLNSFRPIFATMEEEGSPSQELSHPRTLLILPEGHAEKTFYTVCTHSAGGGLSSSDDEVTNVVNDILTDINNDILIQSDENVISSGQISNSGSSNNNNCASSSGNTATTCGLHSNNYSNNVNSGNISIKGSSGKSGSLVVDVHINPDGSSLEEETSSEIEMRPSISAGSSVSSTSTVSSSNSSGGKVPSKHAINRFQRCYSDSSHSNQNGFRGKYTKWIKAQENADKIETLYDASTSSSSALPQTTSANNNLSSPLGIKSTFEPIGNRISAEGGGMSHRYRHFSESAYERFNLQEELFQFKQNFNNHYSRNRGLRSFENGVEQKQKSDPVKIDGVKFDIFGDESSNPDENIHKDPQDSENIFEDEEGLNSNGNINKSGIGISSLSASTSSLRGTSSSSVPNHHHPLYPLPPSSSIPVAPSCMGTLQSDSSSVEEDDLYRGRLPPPFSSVLVETGSCLSNSSSTVSLPACRICQLPSMEPNNQLISPCRCLGSIRYVHNNCLLKWLEVSSKRRNGTASCELCQYQYLRHKKFVITHWRFPECSFRDKILHLFFIISVCLMITCAAVTILCFKEDRGPYRKVNSNQGELTSTEMITLSCGVLFFFAFFIAMYVEVKAKNTVYQLICKFFYMNHEWSVEEYDRRRDLMCSKSSPKNESTSCLA